MGSDEQQGLRGGMEREAPPRSPRRTTPFKRGQSTGPWPAARGWGQWPFVTAGFNAAAAQGLLVRLLLVSFSGNELSIGLMLGNWLLAEAAGSLLASRLASRLGNARKSFALLQIMFAVVLLLVVGAGYLVRRIARVAPGEAPGLSAIFWASLVLAPLSAVHGAMFSVGCQACLEHSRGGAESQANAPYIAGRLYSAEALGATCGGAILSFVLIPHLSPPQTGLMLALSALTTAGLVLGPLQAGKRSRGAVAAGVLAALCLCFLFSPQTLALHRALVQARWGGTYHIVYDRDSPYGNIAVAQLLGQYTFLSNGVPILTTPIPDIATVEETVHLPLLFQPNPRRVLVIGEGLGGVLDEFFKYPLQSLDYAELDPLLIEVVRAYPTELTQRELSDSRLSVHTVDGRRLLNEAASAPRYVPGEVAPYSYDVVLVNLPYPSTLELNRFYTEEFFHMVRRVLNTDGLAVFRAPGSLTYLGPSARDLNLMLRAGLQSVFPNVRAIPGDTNLWLGSPTLPLASATQQELVSIWQVRGLATLFVTTEDVRERFDPQRLAWFEGALQRTQPVERNRDLTPSGVLYGLAYWSQAFAPGTYRLLTVVQRIHLWQWCLISVALTLLAGLAQRIQHQRKASAVPIVVATTGFSGMVCDLLIVLLFQTIYGYVYRYVGLIIAAFMAGLALGGRAALRRHTVSSGGRAALIRSELALILYWLALPVLLTALASTQALELVMPILLLLNAIGGCLVGWQFPLSSRWHLRNGEASRSLGILYAADLAGAFLGALAVGIALLPVLGTVGTCLFVAVLKACSLTLLLHGSKRSGKVPQSLTP
jgi:spermidine synthase